MGDPEEKKGIEGAFERWVERFRGPLIGLLASWGSDWRQAEELAQDTFAEAWIGRKRFDGSVFDMHTAGAWLRGIAFHLHQAAQRKNTRSRTTPLTDPLPLPEEEPEDPRMDALRAAFARLSAPHQTILRMHYLEEVRARDVAALLGMTPKAVENRLYEARKALKNKLRVTSAQQTEKPMEVSHER